MPTPRPADEATPPPGRAPGPHSRKTTTVNTHVIDAATTTLADTHAKGEPYKVRVIYRIGDDPQLHEQRSRITPGYSTLADLPVIIANPRNFTAADVHVVAVHHAPEHTR
ncbi:hypothetical protein [Kitasatospora sp. NPDC094016]|uniref:hypothetical protein n=1 Tax=Kitasatospora sp. NPDC094016 TaxID=3154986 RepID=UPI003317A7A9